MALAAALGLPAALVVPPLAARRPGQGSWVVVGGVPVLAGIMGLLVAPGAAPLLWALLYGIGTGVSFPLAMTLILQRTRDVSQTGRLSGSAQSLGYLVAASGPLAVGLLHESLAVGRPGWSCSSSSPPPSWSSGWPPRARGWWAKRSELTLQDGTAVPPDDNRARRRARRKNRPLTHFGRHLGHPQALGTA